MNNEAATRVQKAVYLLDLAYAELRYAAKQETEDPRRAEISACMKEIVGTSFHVDSIYPRPTGLLSQ